MIFSKTLDLVLSGRKSQTRRIRKPHEYMNTTLQCVEATSEKGDRVVYQVGKTYAVQPGRAKKAVAYIVLRAVRDEPVEDISEADALAEGFDTREDFFATWHAIHGVNADLKRRVWVLTFELLTVYNKTAEEDPSIGGQTPVKMPRPSGKTFKSQRISQFTAGDIDTALHRKISTTEDTET
jgi:hypothetical protein